MNMRYFLCAGAILDVIVNFPLPNAPLRLYTLFL